MSDASPRELAHSSRSRLAPAKRVVVIRLRRSPFPGAVAMHALFLWALFNVFALVAARMHPSTAAVVALISLSAVVAGAIGRKPGRAGLGIDGVWLASGSRRRFIAYRDVYRVRLTRIGVRLVHDDGTFTLAPMRRADPDSAHASIVKVARRCANPHTRVALDAIAAAGNDVELDAALEGLPSATPSHRE